MKFVCMSIGPLIHLFIHLSVGSSAGLTVQDAGKNFHKSLFPDKKSDKLQSNLHFLKHALNYIYTKSHLSQFAS